MLLFQLLHIRRNALVCAGHCALETSEICGEGDGVRSAGDVLYNVSRTSRTWYVVRVRGTRMEETSFKSTLNKRSLINQNSPYSHPSAP